MAKNLKLTIKPPVSIREKIYAKIRNEILNGRISSGERMVETHLAQQTNTSRTPVREALHMLEMEGLLEAIPRVGYRVKKIEWNEVEEICAIRGVNETLAAQWAMKRITPKELQALENNLAVAEFEVEEKEPKSFVTRDAEFHEILVRASGSERLFELCQTLRRHMLRYRIESLYLPETAFRAIKGHRRIVDCIRGKDESGVEAAIREHLEQFKHDIHRYAFLESEKKGPVLRQKNR